MTRARELQAWLRTHGPATMSEIQAAGFTNFGGVTRDRMMKYGAIEAYRGPNPHSGTRHARIITTLYIATDVDYTPPRGARPGTPVAAEIREASIVSRAVKTLTQRGYTIIPPSKQGSRA